MKEKSGAKMSQSGVKTGVIRIVTREEEKLFQAGRVTKLFVPKGKFET